MEVPRIRVIAFWVLCGGGGGAPVWGNYNLPLDLPYISSQQILREA